MAYYSILSIALGSFIGSILRYTVSSYISQRTETSFPHGTIYVNIMGSFLLGCFIALNTVFKLNHYTFLILATGFAGAFTTFSTAMYELYTLIEDKKNKEAVIYFLYTMVGGILAAIIGYWTLSYVF